MADQLTVLRLHRSEHQALKDLAVARGTTVSALATELLEQYAAGPVPKAAPKATPQNELTRTRVELSAVSRRKVDKRAKAEGRSVSRAFAALIAEAAEA